jgi:hypothetical protein
VGEELPQRRNAPRGCADPHDQQLIRVESLPAETSAPDSSAIVPH